MTNPKSTRQSAGFTLTAFSDNSRNFKVLESTGGNVTATASTGGNS